MMVKTLIICQVKELGIYNIACTKINCKEVWGLGIKFKCVILSPIIPQTVWLLFLQHSFGHIALLFKNLEGFPPALVLKLKM